MTLDETMHAIESEEFAAEMNLAAGTKAFRRAIREHHLFRRLAELSKDNSAGVMNRIESISHLEVDERYENRFDTALSAYMMALSDVAEPDLVNKAASDVLRTPKCWWAPGIARELLVETVAVGVVGMGQGVSSILKRIVWKDVGRVGFIGWFNQIENSRSDEAMRRILRVLRAGQPAGQGNDVIEIPSPESRAIHQPGLVRSLKRRKGPLRPHNIAAARNKASLKELHA